MFGPFGQPPASSVDLEATEKLGFHHDLSIEFQNAAKLIATGLMASPGMAPNMMRLPILKFLGETGRNEADVTGCEDSLDFLLFEKGCFK